MATVQVKDKIAPSITCPSTQTEVAVSADGVCEASLSDYTDMLLQVITVMQIQP